MDRDYGREEEILDGEANPDRRTISLESESFLSILWELWRLSVATHRLFGSGGFKERDFKGRPEKIRGVEGGSSDHGYPFTPILWLSGQDTTEGQGKSVRLLPGKITSDCGHPRMSDRASFNKPDASIASKNLPIFFSNGRD